METNNDNKRIAKNTIVLYIWMFFSVVVGLYTSRVVLMTLGEENYGVYSIVAGFVMMFGFLNAAMSGATSRFITFELGKGDLERLKKTFSSCLVTHLLIAAIVFVLLESIGLWYVNSKLVLPENRMAAANIVYQCAVLAMIIGIIKVPFSADIIAHERMNIYASIELLHVVLKLAIVFLLVLFSYDKLVTYAFLLLFVAILLLNIYVIYGLRHFPECNLRVRWNKEVVLPMLKFSGWNVLNEIGFVVRVQGSNIVINRFFGVIVNAATGLASTVQGVLAGFSSSVITAFRPQVIKRYSVGEIESMEKLMCSCIRLSLSLLWLVTIPIFVHMDFVLELWLKDVPEFTNSFCRISLLSNILAAYISILTIGIHATGRLKLMCIITNVCYLCLPIVQYIVFLCFPAAPPTAYILILVALACVCISDTMILKHLIQELTVWPLVMSFLKTVCVALVVLVVSAAFKYFLSQESLLFVFLSVVLIVLLLCSLTYSLVLEEKERTMVVGYCKKILHF